MPWSGYAAARRPRYRYDGRPDSGPRERREVRGVFESAIVVLRCGEEDEIVEMWAKLTSSTELLCLTDGLPTRRIVNVLQEP